MENQSRIPALNELSPDGALMWFSQLQCAGLLFHPEDDPDTLVRIDSGEKLFSPTEVAEVREILDSLEKEIGHEQVIDAAYPIFMNSTGIQLDA